MEADDVKVLDSVKDTDIVCVRGTYDHIHLVLEAIGVPFSHINPSTLLSMELKPEQTVYVNCPSSFPREAALKLRDFVTAGGQLITTDWALLHVVEVAFPNTIKFSGNSTGDEVVAVEIVDKEDEVLKGMKFTREKNEAPFKTKCHQCFRNLYRTFNTYIGRPIYISDVRYLYPTSGYLYLTSVYLYPTSGYLYPTSRYLYPTSGYLYPTSGYLYLTSEYLYPTSGFLYPTSDIYIRRSISISDVRYLYATSDIYIRCPISISDVRYLYPTSDIYIRRPIYNTRLWLGLGLGQGYRTSDIDIGIRYTYRTSYIYIGHPIYILDIRYRFRKHWWHFVLNGTS